MSTLKDTGITADDIIRFGDDPTRTFSLNLKAVQERIIQATQRCGRAPSNIRLLPVTKTVPAHILQLAFSAGITTFAENKLQEARDKRAILEHLPIDWCIIGHLQTNKVKYLTRFASEFHALDSLNLAKEINKRLEAQNRNLDVFIQVNTSGEASKYGLHPDELNAFIERLPEFHRLKPKGLMTLAIFSNDTDRVRSCFQLLNSLREKAARLNPAITQLSMGMSSDFEIAIEEGATIIRVGQAIFGTRPQSDAFYWPGLTS